MVYTAAEAWIGSLVWELPYATGVAKKEKKNDTNGIIYKTETDSDTEDKFKSYQRGEGVGKG